MIFDRTQEDVNTAVTIRENKVKNFQELSENDITTLERGLLTINTLNRIEHKQKELTELLVGAGYSFLNIETKDWSQNEIFNEVDFDRIITNLDALKQAASEMASTPKTPEPKYHFQNINDIEKILFDLDFLIENTRKNINFAWAIGIADAGFSFTS